MAQQDFLNTLRKLLREAVTVRFEGAAYAKLSRVHGYADGYMAALLDAGIVDRDKLLELVREERLKHGAPLSAATH
jgi:hypothetical protein